MVASGPKQVNGQHPPGSMLVSGAAPGAGSPVSIESLPGNPFILIEPWVGLP